MSTVVLRWLELVTKVENHWSKEDASTLLTLRMTPSLRWVQCLSSWGTSLNQTARGTGTPAVQPGVEAVRETQLWVAHLPLWARGSPDFSTSLPGIWDLRPAHPSCSNLNTTHNADQLPREWRGKALETDHSVESGCGETGGFGGKGIHMFFQRITSNVNYLYMREMALEFGQVTKSKNREGEGERGEEYR